jgi:hypothetical protein
MIKACYSKDLSEYFERMVSVCSNWGGVLDDDVSLLILRFGDAK